MELREPRSCFEIEVIRRKWGEGAAIERESQKKLEIVCGMLY